MPEADISQYTSVFRAGDRNRIRRNRATVSCTACQRRKSKCDRRQPCGACEKRNERDNCKYGAGGAGSSGSGGAGRKEAQLRLTRLEEMVRGLAQQDPEKLKGSPRIIDRLNTGEEVEQPFQGATSWNSLVESIRCIQDLLHEDQRDEGSPESTTEAEEPNFFFSNTSTITIPEIVRSLPSKEDCNRIITAYFNAKFQAMPFIHTNQFQRRYEAFWEDPASAGFLWISLFFGVLTAGAKIARVKFSGDPNVLQTVQEPKFYMERAAQCLIAGQFLKDKAGSVEALLMHAHSRNIQKVDADPIIWAIYGLVVRLAQRQGYHRDAAKVSASITPFEAEMRRRVWFMIQSSDLLFSFQHGMPPMIYEDVCDVGHPTNLLDADFDEDTAVLPPPRSDIDPTPILAWSTKSGLCSVLRRIMRHALNVTLPPFSETMALNAQLEQWYSACPASLRIRSIKTTSFIDPNHTIMHRIMLELMFRKAQCVLHRPYISLHKDDPAYNISRQICRNAALTMLNLHIELDQEITPGGRMYEDRFMVSSLTLQHFLIASTISCLDVMESIDLRCVINPLLTRYFIGEHS